MGTRSVRAATIRFSCLTGSKSCRKLSLGKEELKGELEFKYSGTIFHKDDVGKAGT